jgi:hypothetical protein
LKSRINGMDEVSEKRGLKTRERPAAEGGDEEKT